jgi:hypothetical protein
VTSERVTRDDGDGDGDGDGMQGADAAPTRDDLPDVTDFSDYGGGGTDGDWGGGSGNANEEDDFSPQQVATSSLRDHLMSQLALLNLPLRDRQVVAALIDALDDDGYLASSLEEIAEMFSEHDALEPEELTIGLKYLQSFEPCGRRRPQSGRMPDAAIEAAAGIHTFSRGSAEGGRGTPAPAGQPGLHQVEARAALRRRRASSRYAS